MLTSSQSIHEHIGIGSDHAARILALEDSRVVEETPAELVLSGVERMMGASERGVVTHAYRMTQMVDHTAQVVDVRFRVHRVENVFGHVEIPRNTQIKDLIPTNCIRDWMGVDWISDSGCLPQWEINRRVEFIENDAILKKIAEPRIEHGKARLVA